MGLFHCDCKEKEEEIKRLLNIIEIQAQSILNLTKPHPDSVKLVLINKQTNQIIMANATLASNQQIVAVLSLVDAVTGLPVTGSFSGTSVTSDNPAAGSTSVSADNASITFVAAAAGVANLSIATTASFTDSTGAAQTTPFTQAVQVTVTAVVVADQVTLVVTFGQPTAQ